MVKAERLAASLEERERLSRRVHDGAIQVLALVSRRGREIGGETAQLAELAGEQERALRRLVSAPDPEVHTGGVVDIGALLRARASDRVSVSLPAEPVLLEDGPAHELFAAASNALGDGSTPAPARRVLEFFRACAAPPHHRRTGNEPRRGPPRPRRRRLPR